MKKNNNIIVLGANGFIASNLKDLVLKKKKKINFISSKELDLTKKNSFVISWHYFFEIPQL